MKILSIILIVLTLVGCSESSSRQAETADGLTRATLQLNWKPEPQFGGFFAAIEPGRLMEGLQIDIADGLPGTPTTQMLGASRVDFAIVSADELVIARSRGIDIVAIFAVYQTNPQGLMTPASRGLTSIDQIFQTPGTLAIEQGLPYAFYLKQKYGFDKLNVVPSPGGDLTAFRTQPDYAMQCFVTSEPLNAKAAGLEATTFLIADAGWNPYTTVLACRGDLIRENPTLVKRMARAVRNGWSNYLTNPDPVNQGMHALNPVMDLETFAASAQAQLPLIQTEQLGAMTLERWQTLVDQLSQLPDMIDQPVKAEECFFNPFE